MNTIDKDTVLQLHSVLEGDPLMENMVLAFIAHKYQARSLFHLPTMIPAQILRRPVAFLKAVKAFHVPDLPF